MKVKNITGTAGRDCGCDSWLAHWHNYNSGQIANRRRATGCGGNATAGAHVHKETSGNNSHYIVPFCQPHNMQTNPKWIEINSGTDLVSANKQKTCK